MVHTASSHPLSRLMCCLLFTALLLAFLTQAAVVQGAAPPTESLTSAAPSAPALERYLTPDGTLALPAGFAGSLDTRGWALASGENEAPRFIPASPGLSGLGLDSAESSPPRLPGDERWEAGFHPRGVMYAYALAAGAGSDVYVGGSFVVAGSTVARSIAKWNGSQWSALGYGLNSTVDALAWDSTRGILYAGGAFDAICANADCTSRIQANHVAQWNGTVWSPLASIAYYGVNGVVSALALDPQHNLYVGGFFSGLCTDSSCNGTDSANYIAKWTLSGSSGTWSTLSTGTNAGVLALAWWNSLAGGRLVVGGWFTQAGGLAANYLAMWDGSTWSSFWSGVDGTVTALAVDPGIGAVVVGGTFTHICATTAAPPTCNTPPETQVNHVAVTTFFLDYWGPLGWGVDDEVHALTIDSAAKRVHAGGNFLHICSDQPCTGGTVTPASHVAVVDYHALPYTWSAPGSGTDYAVYALALQANSPSAPVNTLYAGGDLQVAGGVPASGMARWALSGPGPWSALGTGDGLSGNAEAVAADGAGNIYVGGTFRTAGGIIANNIARWNLQTRTWSALGHGVDNRVFSLALDNEGTLFVGGQFHNICSNPDCTLGSRVNHLARWSEAQGWSSVDYGVSDTVYALASAPDGNLYVGGLYNLKRCPDADCTNPTEGHGLLRWTPQTNRLSAFGVGVYDGSVDALAFDSRGNLYIGGLFVNLCTGACSAAIPVNHIAKWNSGGVGAVGNGVDARVFTLAVDANDRLFAGGEFRYTCAASSPCGQGTSLNRIGLWTPSGTWGSWSSLQHGLSGPVYAITLDSAGHPFATGDFRGTCPNEGCATPEMGVNSIAKWDGTSWSALGSGLGGQLGIGWALIWHAGILSVGGYFETAGDKSSVSFARYADLLPPPAPILTAPADGTVFTRNQTIPFSWNPSTDADLYLLEALQNGQVVWNDTTPSPTLVRSASADPPGSYQWRVQAFNSVGQSEWSATRAYSVKPAPPSGLSLEVVSSTQIDLNWTASSDAVFLDGYRLYRNGVAIATVGPSTTTYANTGLACHTTYSYLVKAYKGSVESDPTNTATASTLTCPPPSAPSLLTAWAASSTQLNLTWQDNSSNESAFYLERSPNGTTGWAQVGEVGANVTSYADTNRTCHTTYYYRVRAYRSSDNQYSTYSNVASATTVACNAPVTPGNLTASSTSKTKIHLSWQDLSSDESDFHLERSPNGLSGWTEIAVLPAGSTSYDNQPLACGTLYAYRLRAHRHSDNQFSGYSNVATATTQACSGTTKQLFLPFVRR